MNDFVEISKKLNRYRSENNFVGLLKYLCKQFMSISNATRSFDIQTINEHSNYFPTKLFPILYQAKFLNISANCFFCVAYKKLSIHQ